ncbi:MAG: G-D-S-L family lipolytic protein [Flavobacterium sp.]|uniref:G-D-S-L family lipolytic protein n=1 Tax=Flavobacterium sp. TaxID=239 RepID=UPI0022CCBD19|nr:G-D-S-L family lipolytic protein [Flavobacterium sp.]MCZ8196357.1 G-D-S-L family lipolytic protein [Flavobacterium sp.]
MIKNFKWLFLVAATFIACESDDETTTVVEEPLTAGSADFSKFVSVGNSLTAGFSDGALFKDGQSGSYTNILAQQFAKVGGGEFKIPFMADNIGGFSISGNQGPAPLGVRKFFNGCGPADVSGISGTVLGASIATSGPYNNTGVPGAKCIHLVIPGYATANPYFGRIATSPTQTVLNYATTQTPTFFSLWIGNNDVLGYALNGGDATLDQITPSAGAPGVGFDASYNAIVDGLTANGAKGVVANIPYVTSIPMFTTIPVKPVNPNSYFADTNEPNCSVVYPISAGDVATINTINANLMGALSSIVPDRFSLLSTTSNNPLLIIDESLEDKGPTIVFAATNSGNPTLVALASYLGATYGKARQTKTGDLIPLTTRAVIGTQNTSLPISLLQQGLGAYGITYPLQDRHVLVPTEIAELKAATDAFNATIESVATSKGLAFVNANELLTKVATTGVSSNGYTVKSTFVTGGAFSLDGVHPSPRGYAVIANAFMDAINKKYGSNLKPVDISKYRIQFPSSL